MRAQEMDGDDDDPGFAAGKPCCAAHFVRFHREDTNASTELKTTPKLYFTPGIAAFFFSYRRCTVYKVTRSEVNDTFEDRFDPPTQVKDPTGGRCNL